MLQLVITSSYNSFEVFLVCNYNLRAVNMQLENSSQNGLVLSDDNSIIAVRSLDDKLNKLFIPCAE